MTTAFNVVGIDPSQRHTGVCFLTEAGPFFTEIKTGTEDVLTSSQSLRRHLRSFLREHNAQNAVFCIEKQLSVGGNSSSLMFHMQMNVLEVVRQLSPSPVLIMPLPVQLQSYIRRRHGCENPKSATQVVAAAKRALNLKGRFSQHLADAYFLGILARDVLAGTWSYKKPSREQPLVPWEIVNVKQ